MFKNVPLNGKQIEEIFLLFLFFSKNEYNKNQKTIDMRKTNFNLHKTNFHSCRNISLINIPVLIVTRLSKEIEKE